MHIYTGDGKGKTTAAVGLAVRAAGAGRSVLFVQFLKGRATGELASLNRLGVSIARSERVLKFIPFMTRQELEECKSAQQACLLAARRGLNTHDIVILDEAMAAISTGMVTLKSIKELILSKPENVELVLTGRDASPELVALADYVSEIKSVKHPFDNGVAAREGIEF